MFFFCSCNEVVEQQQKHQQQTPLKDTKSRKISIFFLLEFYDGCHELIFWSQKVQNISMYYLCSVFHLCVGLGRDRGFDPFQLLRHVGGDKSDVSIVPLRLKQWINRSFHASSSFWVTFRLTSRPRPCDV